MRASTPPRVATDRHRRTHLVGLVLAVLTLVGCSQDAATPTATPSTAGAGTLAPLPDGDCEERERPEVVPSVHLDEVSEVTPFTSVPATSGVHEPDIPVAGQVTPEPLQDVEIVSAVENGIVVLAIDPDAMATADQETIDSLLAQFPDRLLVTAYDEHPLPTPVTMVSWGVLQRCESVDLAATTAFVLQERLGLVDALE